MLDRQVTADLGLMSFVPISIFVASGRTRFISNDVTRTRLAL
jgi:hypothetical protein